MRPRGTTLWIEHRPTQGRTLEWGLFRNVYQHGFIGRPKVKSNWFATEAEALATKAAVEAAMASTEPAPLIDVTGRRADSLAVLAVEWLAFVKKMNRAATWRNYGDCMRNYIAPAPGHKRYPGLGNLIVSDATCTPKVFFDFIELLHEQGISLSMRRRVLRVIQACLTYAKVHAGRLTKDNPCNGMGTEIKHEGEEEQEPEPNPFTRDEIKQLFDYLYAFQPDWALFFQFMYDTGVRPGEASGLKWDAFKPDTRRARIEWQWSPSAGKDLTPKIHERRDIDLTSLIVERLLEWHPKQRQWFLLTANPQTPYVFTTRLCNRIKQDGRVRTVFALALEACGIKGHVLYDLRHSFASHHLSDDWDRKLTWVSKQLGHKNVSTTERSYYAYRPTLASRGFADDLRVQR